jgi:hypothetical protein
VDERGISCTDLPIVAKQLPIHILPPLPNAQNHRIISSLFSRLASSQRSGFHASGSRKTSAFRCKEYAWALTRVPAGMSVYPQSEIGEPAMLDGVIRSWDPGTAGRRRCVSRRMPSRREEYRFGVVMGGWSSFLRLRLIE